MQKALLLVGFIAILAVAGAVGAGVYRAVEMEDIQVESTSEATLTSSQAIGLALTAMAERSGGILKSACLGGSAASIDAATATYDKSGKWVLTFGLCVFVVNDATGRVIGP